MKETGHKSIHRSIWFIQLTADERNVYFYLLHAGEHETKSRQMPGVTYTITPGDVLVSVREAEKFIGLTRRTVKKALDSLVKKGLISLKKPAPFSSAYTTYFIQYFQKMDESTFSFLKQFPNLKVMTQREKDEQQAQRDAVLDQQRKEKEVNDARTAELQATLDAFWTDAK